MVAIESRSRGIFTLCLGCGWPMSHRGITSQQQIPSFFDPFVDSQKLGDRANSIAVSQNPPALPDVKKSLR